MRLRRIVARMIVCSSALACGLLPASASAATGPKLVGSISDSVDLSGATSVAVSGNFAYTTAYFAGELTAVDISSPKNPVIAGHSAPLSADPRANNVLNAETVAVAGGYAYVVSKNRNGPCMPGPAPTNCQNYTGIPSANDDGTGNALTIFDIHTNPAQPAIVGTLRDPNKLFGAYGIAVQGGFAYVASQGCLSGQPCPDPTVGNQFVVINVSNPAAPSLVPGGDITNPGLGTFKNALLHADSVSLSGHFAYVTASYSHDLTVIDISNPAAPAIVAKLGDATNLTFANDVATQGTFAYVASQTTPSGRLAVVDISNPLSPTVVGSVSDPVLSGAYRVHVRGRYAFVSGSSSDTLSMIDISDPTAPKIVAHVSDSSHLHRTLGLDFALSGRYVITSSPYLTTQAPGLYPPLPPTGGLTATGTVSVIDADPSPVSVSITSPLSGSNYRQGQVIAAAYTCTPGGLIPVVSCAGPVPNGARIDTSTLGQHTFTVTGQDQDGQTGSGTVTYTVSTVGGARPVVSGLHQSAKVWREHGRKHARHKPPLGTKFTFTLSEPANVTLSFTRRMSGRKVRGRCVAPTKRNRHHRACQRTVRAGTLMFIGSTGRNKFAFQGKINGHFLKPGTYIVAVTASANGLVSSRSTLKFTIV